MLHLFKKGSILRYSCREEWKEALASAIKILLSKVEQYRKLGIKIIFLESGFFEVDAIEGIYSEFNNAKKFRLT